MPIKKIVDKMQNAKDRAKAIAAKPKAAPPKAPTGTRGIGTVSPAIAKMIGNKFSSATTPFKSLMANNKLGEIKARQAAPKIGAIPRPAGTVSPNAAKMVGKTLGGTGMKKGGKAKKK